MPYLGSSLCNVLMLIGIVSKVFQLNSYFCRCFLSQLNVQHSSVSVIQQIFPFMLVFVRCGFSSLTVCSYNFGYCASKYTKNFSCISSETPTIQIIYSCVNSVSSDLILSQLNCLDANDACNV